MSSDGENNGTFNPDDPDAGNAGGVAPRGAAVKYYKWSEQDGVYTVTNSDNVDDKNRFDASNIPEAVADKFENGELKQAGGRRRRSRRQSRRQSKRRSKRQNGGRRRRQSKRNQRR